MSLGGTSGISFLQACFTGVPSGFILCIVKCSFPGNIVSGNCPDVTGALFCYEECSNYDFLWGDAQSFYESSTKKPDGSPTFGEFSYPGVAVLWTWGASLVVRCFPVRSQPGTRVFFFFNCQRIQHFPEKINNSYKSSKFDNIKLQSNCEVFRGNVRNSVRQFIFVLTKFRRTDTLSIPANRRCIVSMGSFIVGLNLLL